MFLVGATGDETFCYVNQYNLNFKLSLFFRRKHMWKKLKVKSCRRKQNRQRHLFEGCCFPGVLVKLRQNSILDQMLARSLYIEL